MKRTSLIILSLMLFAGGAWALEKEDAIEYRKQILSLKGSLNKLKQSPDFTVKELESGSGIADIIISKFGLGKYKKFLQPYLPQIE